MERKIQPISFEEFQESYKNYISDEVIEAVNELIFKKWNGYNSHFTESDLIEEIKKPLDFLLSHEEYIKKVKANGWLRSFPRLYREKGWTVTVDYPNYIRGIADTEYTFTKKE